MLKYLKTITAEILDLLLPTRCKSCGLLLKHAPVSCFCYSCWHKIRAIKAPFCFVCGKPFPSKKNFKYWEINPLCYFCRKQEPCFEKARAALVYEKVSRQAIHLFKFKDKSSLAKPLSQFLVQVIREDRELLESEVIIPVPLSRASRRQRDYNPVLLLAREAALQLDKPLATQTLRKIKETLPQVGLKRKQRLKNLRGAFGVTGNLESVSGKKVLLVDDLFTTGATASECTLALKKAGACQVCVVTLARGM